MSFTHDPVGGIFTGLAVGLVIIISVIWRHLRRDEKKGG